MLLNMGEGGRRGGFGGPLSPLRRLNSSFKNAVILLAIFAERTLKERGAGGSSFAIVRSSVSSFPHCWGKGGGTEGDRMSERGEGSGFKGRRDLSFGKKLSYQYGKKWASGDGVLEGKEKVWLRGKVAVYGKRKKRMDFT